MDELEAMKSWGKALGLFVAGFTVSTYLLMAVAGVFMSLARDTQIKINWGYMTLASILIGSIFFLIFWGWFRFRSRLTLEPLKWYELGIAGLVVIPLLTIFSLPLIMLKIRDAAPMLFEIALPVFTLLLVSETASWIARLRNAGTSHCAIKNPIDDGSPREDGSAIKTNDIFGCILTLIIPVLGLIFTVIFYAMGQEKRAIRYFVFTAIVFAIWCSIFLCIPRAG